MPRLLACPSCRRHVLASERDCPFCGHVGVTTSATSTRVSALLLGLCLAGCASTTTDDSSKTDAKGTKVDSPPEPAPPEPTQPQPEPTPAPEVEQPEPTPPEPAPNDTAIAPDPQPVEDTGTADGGGATIDDPAKPSVDTPQKTKYGGPRPAKKYGAPPKPTPMPE